MSMICWKVWNSACVQVMSQLIVWDIPFLDGICLYNTVNIWNKLKCLEVGLYQQVVTVSFCKQFWVWRSWKAGETGVCFRFYQSPGSSKTNEAVRATLLTSVAQKAENSNSRQGSNTCFLAPLSCKDKGSWGSQQPLCSPVKSGLKGIHLF